MLRCLPSGGDKEVEFCPGPVDLLVSLPVNIVRPNTTPIIAAIAIPIPMAILAFTIKINHMNYKRHNPRR
jgi:hypothetical protein